MENTEQTARFTCTYGPSEETFRQIYLTAHKSWRIFWFIFAGAFLIYIGYHMTNRILWSLYAGEPLLTEPMVWLFIGELALVGFLTAWELTGPKRYAKKQLRRIAETYGGKDPIVRVSFCDDEMRMYNEASDSRMQMSYATIARCVETKTAFLLITQEKQFLSFPKDCFEGIDIPGVRAFFDAKCPNAKRNLKKADA